MDSVLKALEKVLSDENGFFVQVKNMDGLNDEKLRDLLDALHSVERFYADNDLVPKYLVQLTLPLESSLLMMVDKYSESARGKIFIAIDQINTALDRCFFPEQFYR